MPWCETCGEWRGRTAATCSEGHLMPSTDAAPDRVAGQSRRRVWEAQRRAEATRRRELVQRRVQEALQPLERPLTAFGLPVPPVPDSLEELEGLSDLIDEYGAEDKFGHFECATCGRWASILDAYEALDEALVGLGGLPVWSRLRNHAEQGDLRLSSLQRDDEMTYEEAVGALEQAVTLGLLKKSGANFVAAGGVCAECLARACERADRGQPTEVGTREAVPPQLRFRVLRRDGFRCQYCGRSARDGATLHLDHVVPVAAGGTTSEENLITACEACNLGKSAGSVV